MSLYEAELYETPGTLHEWELPGELGHETFETGELFESAELHEALEMELAHELLEVMSEAELEQFLGKLVRSVGKAASGFIRSPIGKALGGVLKNVAKTALPMVGSALGSFVAPGIGTAIGGKLGSMASNLFEVGELEMMGEAEAEFEMARRYVQWARGTTRNAMRAPVGVAPSTVVRSAAVSSARRHAPALLRTGPATNPHWRSRRPSQTRGPLGGVGTVVNNMGVDPWAGASMPSDVGADDGSMFGGSPGDAGDVSGRWVRRGSRIVLFNV